MLDTYFYRFKRDGLWHEHQRHVFRVDAADIGSDQWETLEMSPDSGGPPIRFRFFWLPFSAARNQLDFGFAESVDLVWRPVGEGL